LGLTGKNMAVMPASELTLPFVSVQLYLLAHLVSDVSAASRVIANIVTGVGFLGAGIIYRNSSAGTSHGLTTAATVWCTAAVGVAVGLNMFIIAIVGAIALYFLLSLHHQPWYVKWKKKMVNKHNENTNTN
jgi:putative Mg2+ transporter-C (MgtC) family protein